MYLRTVVVRRLSFHLGTKCDEAGSLASWSVEGPNALSELGTDIKRAPGAIESVNVIV